MYNYFFNKFAAILFSLVLIAIYFSDISSSFLCFL